jgi:putative peptidoglycan lipid II flippase
MLHKTLKLSSISIISNFVGFLIPVYIAYQYAISKETDDFFLSYGVIMFVGTIFSGAVRSVSIPFLKEKINDKISYDLFISSVLYYLILFLGLLCLTLCIVAIYLKYHTGETLYWYLFLSVPIVFFSIINSFCYGILNSSEQFYLAEMAPFSRAILIFISIYLFSDSLGMGAVIVGYNIGEFGKFIHLIFVIKIKNKINISIKNRNIEIVNTFITQGSFQVLSSAIVGATPLVNRIIASFLVAGSISLLDYGDKVFTVFTVILNSFLVLILSKWSKDVIDGNFHISHLHKSMLLIFTLSIILFIIVLTFSELIISTIYPKVSSEHRSIIESILIINTVGFIFNSVSQVINRATIALKSTKIMITTSIYRLISNIILGTLFVQLWGILGISIATIGVHIIGLSMNYYLFSRKLKVKLHSNQLN